MEDEKGLPRHPHPGLGMLGFSLLIGGYFKHIPNLPISSHLITSWQGGINSAAGTLWHAEVPAVLRYGGDRGCFCGIWGISMGQAVRAREAVGKHSTDGGRASGDAPSWTGGFLAARGEAWSRSAGVHVDRLQFWSSGHGNFVSLFKILKWERNVKIWGTLQVCLC